MGLFGRRTTTGRTFGRKTGRKVGIYKPRTGGKGRIIRTWKPRK